MFELITSKVHTRHFQIKRLQLQRYAVPDLSLYARRRCHSQNYYSQCRMQHNMGYPQPQ